MRINQGSRTVTVIREKPEGKSPSYSYKGVINRMREKIMDLEEENRRLKNRTEELEEKNHQMISWLAQA